MPQPFEQAVLTNQGEELLAKITAGQGQIEYVCMSVGSGVYSAAEKVREALKERESLKAEKNRYTFSTACVEDKTVRLTALLTNQDPLTSEGLVEEGYYINEVGIFAKEQGTGNSTAILYSICVTAGDMGDYMPAFDGRNRSEITQDYILSVDDSTKISVNMIGAVALARDVEKNKSEIKQYVQESTDATYQQATGYTDQKIADLINGAPETLDTLGEISQAMKDNEDVVEALQQAIGSRASQAEVDGHIGNNTIHITESERQKWDSHYHDDRYYTETEVNNLLSGKANSSHSHDDRYLSSNGGNLKGNISVPVGKNYNWDTGAGIRSDTGQHLEFRASAEDEYRLTLGVISNAWTFTPNTDDSVALGVANRRWKQIYSIASIISTSDRNQKQDIDLISDKYIALYSLLQPVTYRFRNGSSGRIHVGFIAQDVEAAMAEVGLTDLDFAGFCKDKIGDNYIYSLRYEEFIALNTAVIQRQQAKIASLEQRLEKLEQQCAR